MQYRKFPAPACPIKILSATAVLLLASQITACSKKDGEFNSAYDPAKTSPSIAGKPVNEEKAGGTHSSPTGTLFSLNRINSYELQNGKISGTSLPLSQSEKSPATTALKEPEKTCFTVSFHHKTLRGHTDEESCSHHRNLIKLKHPVARINSKSVCVRVDGTPVKYLVQNGAIVIGPVAGPKAKITARYCIDQFKCNEDCTIPKDEFMDAIAGHDAEAAPNAKVAQWDSDEAPTDADVVAELDSEIRKELTGGNDTSLFEDWVSETETPACVTKIKSG